MATPVPYSGAPNVVPRLEPTPSVGINTPPAAFGVNIAEAAQHLGDVVEGSGKELFDRAYAMQELQEHATATSAMADAQNKGMNLLVDYNNTEGKNAVDGLPAFQSGLEQIRKDGARSLSPYASVLYNDSVRSSLFRLGFSGATHAKDEQKRYIVGAAQGQMSSDMKMMELDPNNPVANQAALDRIRASADHISDIHGLAADDPQRIMARNDAVNKAVIGQIRGLSEKGDFIGATKLFNQAVTDKEIYGEDSARMGEYIKWQRDIHGSRVSAGQVLNHGAGMNLEGATLSDQRILAGLKGSEGGSYNFVGPDVTDKAGNTGHALGHYGVMSYNLQGWLRQAGLGPMTEQEFRNNPEVQDALAVWKFKQYQSQFGSAQAAAKAWFGGPGSVGVDPAKLRDKNMDFNQYWANFTGGVARGSSLSDLTSAARTHAYSQFPGDDDFADATEQRVIALDRQEKAIRADTDFQNDQAISSALYGGVGPQKKIPTTLEELQMDPNAKSAWDDMQMNHPSMMRKYLDDLAKNARGNVAMTPERLNQWQTLSGEAVNDPERFMKDTMDLSQIDLPLAQKQEIIRMQAAIYKKQDVAPQMSHALGIAGPMLDSLGITKVDDPDKRNLFVGILHDVMQQYTRENGKPMSDDDIKSTAQRLLNPVTSGGFWGMFQSKTPWFESIDNIPPEIQSTIRQDFESRGITPDDKALMGAYLAAQYQELYGKSGAKPPSPQRYPQSSSSIKTFQ